MTDRLADREDAGAPGRPVDVDRTCATERAAAAEFGPDEPELLAQDPQERHVLRDIDVALLTVNL